MGECFTAEIRIIPNSDYMPAAIFTGAMASSRTASVSPSIQVTWHARRVRILADNRRQD